MIKLLFNGIQQSTRTMQRKELYGFIDCGITYTRINNKRMTKLSYEYCTHYDTQFTVNNRTRCGMLHTIAWEIATF
jgi:hypothetical protein